MSQPLRGLAARPDAKPEPNGLRTNFFPQTFLTCLRLQTILVCEANGSPPKLWSEVMKNNNNEQEILIVRRDEHGVVRGLYALEAFEPARVRNVGEWIESARRADESRHEGW